MTPIIFMVCWLLAPIALAGVWVLACMACDWLAELRREPARVIELRRRA